MKLSIITVNFNHKYFPKLCVEALERSKTNFPFEIIFMDNASTDLISLGFLKRASDEGRIKFIQSKQNLGFAGGNNLGFKHAKGEFIFILNPDTQVKEDTFQKMVDYLEAHPDVGILGPKLVYPDGSIQESCRRDMKFTDLVLRRTALGKVSTLHKRVERYLMEDFDHERTQAVELVTGAAIMIPRHVLECVGGFDERYFLFMEDFDLCKKVRAAGYKVVYYHSAEVNHYHKRLSSGSLASLLRKKVFWIHVSSAAKYFWKWRKELKKLS